MLDKDDLEDSGAVASFIQEIASKASESSAFLRSLASRSYRHPNGFIKITLEIDSAGAAVRLHHWIQSQEESNLHSHRWNMRSRILRGFYRARDFVEHPSGLERFRHYCSDNVNGQYLVRLDGPACLTVTRDEVYRSGDVYDLNAGDVHHVLEFSPENVLSLVCCSSPRSDHSYIYTETPDAPYNESFAPISSDVLQSILQKAVTAV